MVITKYSRVYPLHALLSLFFGFLLIEGHSQNVLPEVEKRLISSTKYQQYFDSWQDQIKTGEATINNPNTYWTIISMEYWNRFVTYIKLAPDPSSDILVAFMDGYKFDPHDFCDGYNSANFWNNDGYQYILEHHKKEKPVMDALCSCTHATYNADLVQQLQRIKERDQQVRSRLKDHTLDQLKADGSWNHQLTLDSINTVQIAKIIETFGYPGRSSVGKELELVAFLVVQHSNIDFMEKCLPILENAIKQRELHGKYYGYLFDRIAMIQGRPQRYGTQYDLKGKLWKVNDAANLNTRRLKIGLHAL